MGLDNPSHWLIIAVLVIAFFGYKKLPDISRSVGRSLRIFKTEMKGLTDDDEARQASAAGQPTAQAGVASPQPQPQPQVSSQPNVAAQPVPPAQPSVQPTQPAPQQVAGQPAPDGGTVPVNPVPNAAVPTAPEADGSQPHASNVGE